MTKIRTRRQRFKRFLVSVGLIIVLLLAATLVIRHVYNSNLRPVSNDQKSQLVNISVGDSAKQIAGLLHNDGLIRSTWAFEWYVQSKELRADLQAGTYAISPSQDVSTIVNILTKGKVQVNLVTILPGERIDQVRSTLINAGFSPSSVDAALQPNLYSGLTALVDKPANTNLEGLLYPDSFQKTATTNPSTIVRESLVEMGQHLTPSLQTAYAKEGLSIYQGITLASIVEQEVSKASDQAQVAQVFLKRISIGMPLQSDQTAFYGAIIANQPPSVNYDSAYNTYKINSLPPTPISNVNNQALNAVANPAQTNWLYFVAGDNGTTYFEQTGEQHQADVNQYCHKLCAQG
jgi:UPF0755 protein